MYMYYFLGHQLMDNHALTDAQKEVILGNCQKMSCCLKVRAENTFLLALDGDVDFQPEAIIKVTRSIGNAGNLHGGHAEKEKEKQTFDKTGRWWT